jgi:hypothetical protein
MSMNLTILPDTFAICRLDARIDIRTEAVLGEFVSITRTNDELSIVCAESVVPSGMKADRGWRALKVEGPLDLALTGVLASLANPLAEAKINIFAISTFDTDYLLVKGCNLIRACDVLRQAGHVVAEVKSTRETLVYRRR